jgi:hypothetical protein
LTFITHALRLVFVICYFIEGIVTVMAYCDSLEAHWNPKVMATAKCYPETLRNTFGTMNTAFNVFTDVMFASVPVPMLWRLQTKRKVRFYLIGIFSLGYLCAHLSPRFMESCANILVVPLRSVWSRCTISSQAATIQIRPSTTESNSTGCK